MESTHVGRRSRSPVLDLVEAFIDRILDGRMPVLGKLPSGPAQVAEFKVVRTVGRSSRR